jgi:acetaldehyde dehydrogenase (acetylating)
MDNDLLSIQQARDLAVAARAAQRQFLHASQAEVDRICAAIAEAAYAAAERLGRMACEETGYGVPEHKTLKNTLASQVLWDAIKEIPTVGVVRHDPRKKLYDIAWPMGVVAALTPSTNPHLHGDVQDSHRGQGAQRHRGGAPPVGGEVLRGDRTAHGRSGRTRRDAAGAGRVHEPDHAARCAGTDAPQVRRADPGHRRQRHGQGRALGGKPAYGVGPGNVPVYVDRSADLARAAKYIAASKAFDHSVICATEQAVVADKPIAAQLEELMKAEGAYFVDAAEAQALGRLLFTPGPLINPKTVGKSPQQLAQMAGIRVPATARILVARLKEVGRGEPLSAEKLTTVLGWYEADGWEAGCERCLELIDYGGRGHSLVIHAQDDNVVMRFGLEKPVFRILVNTLGTLGATGLTTGVTPSFTLGSGGIGGAITGDNIGVHHMYNVKRLAYEIAPPPAAALAPGSTDDPAQLRTAGALPVNGYGADPVASAASTNPANEADQIAAIVRRVLAELKVAS